MPNRNEFELVLPFSFNKSKKRSTNLHIKHIMRKLPKKRHIKRRYSQTRDEYWSICQLVKLEMKKMWSQIDSKCKHFNESNKCNQLNNLSTMFLKRKMENTTNDKCIKYGSARERKMQKQTTNMHSIQTS